MTKRTATQQAQFDFWTGFRDYATERATRVRPTAPQPGNWMSMAIGDGGFGLDAIASVWTWGGGGPEIRAEFVMFGKDAKQIFMRLRAQRDTIDAELGHKPVWCSEEGVKQCKIYFRGITYLSDH